MARDQRERSVRRDPGLREGEREVRLESSRRFFTAQGNRGPVDKARALQNALGFAVDTYQDVLVERNQKGEERALADAASGKGRDITDKNKGYEEKWQQLEAVNDMADFRHELSRGLVEADWGNMGHEDVQAFIDDYFQNQLAGINMDSAYGRQMATAILQQNAQLLEEHAGILRGKEIEEFRTMGYNALREGYEVNGVVDYRDLEETAKHLPSELKRTFYWESLIDLAREKRDPSDP